MIGSIMQQKQIEKSARLAAQQAVVMRRQSALLPETFLRKVYLIGSLRNPAIAPLASRLRSALPNTIVFDDWLCAGPHADDAWRDHEKNAGYTFLEALERPAAKHVFAFDRKHLEESAAVVLVAPAGKSAHLELGWALGKGKPGFVLMDNPERWDVMYQFATGVTDKEDVLVQWLRSELGYANHS